MPGPKIYQGQQVAVTFDGKRCLHAAACVSGLPSVFNLRKRPWIEPDGADAIQVADVIRRCPSGALTYQLVDGPAEEADRPTTITARPGAPLWVRGDVVVATPDGEAVVTRAALCRCGSTGNAPYCDHSGDCKGR